MTLQTPAVKQADNQSGKMRKFSISICVCFLLDGTAKEKRSLFWLNWGHIMINATIKKAKTGKVRLVITTRRECFFICINRLVNIKQLLPLTNGAYGLSR